MGHTQRHLDTSRRTETRAYADTQARHTGDRPDAQIGRMKERNRDRQAHAHRHRNTKKDKTRTDAEERRKTELNRNVKRLDSRAHTRALTRTHARERS